MHCSQWLKYLTGVNSYHEFSYELVLNKIDEYSKEYASLEYIGHSLKKHYDKALERSNKKYIKC